VRALLLLALSLAGCAEPLPPDEGVRRLELSLAGTRVATLVERTRGRVVERESRLVGLDDTARLRAVLDWQGFVVEARYVRAGGRGGREVELQRVAEAAALLTSRERRFPLPKGPLVLLEVLHHAAPLQETSVTFLDLASGETLPGRVRKEDGAVLALDEHGGLLARAVPGVSSRAGPGAFFEGPPGAAPPLEVVDVRPRLRGALGQGVLLLEGIELSPAALALDGPGQRPLAGVLAIALDGTHRDRAPPPPAAFAPAPFFESDDAQVRAFAALYARGGTPASEALSLAEAIGARLDTSKGGGPPSARNTLERSAGDCDDATALLVAALRARGHAARPVVGYRLFGGRLVPHAWGEVHTAEGWLPVDALVPGLGPFSTHLRLFEGLGSPLTMGRVLGKLRPRLAAARATE
jgi:hypothetical protein